MLVFSLSLSKKKKKKKTEKKTIFPAMLSNHLSLFHFLSYPLPAHNSWSFACGCENVERGLLSTRTFEISSRSRHHGTIQTSQRSGAVRSSCWRDPCKKFSCKNNSSEYNNNIFVSARTLPKMGTRAPGQAKSSPSWVFRLLAQIHKERSDLQCPSFQRNFFTISKIRDYFSNSHFFLLYEWSGATLGGHDADSNATENLRYL